jgi:hypothetical protein
MPEHADEGFTCHAIGDGVDDVSVNDVGQLIALAGEALDVLSKGFT